MIILDKKRLQDFEQSKRIWQGIPSIEVSKNGRIFVTFYSGGIKEDFGNYILLYVSDDDGKSFNLFAVAYNGKDKRTYDASLWIDPLDRLWWSYSVCPNNKLVTSVFTDIDGDIKYAGDIHPGYEVMINKPIVTSWGEWLLPCYVFDKAVIWTPAITSKRKDRKCFVFATNDNGESFYLKSSFLPKNRSFDEMVLLEHNDHHLSAFTRTLTGIAHFESFDKGNSWQENTKSDFKSPSSRFNFTKLKSGRIMQVNHYDFKDRNNLTVLLSDDDGKTWPHKLVIDERDWVSYPDAKETDDGFIYICYDRDRGSFKYNLKDALKCAREILMAKITEEDVIAGKLVNKKSRLKMIVSKLGEYDGDEEYLYNVDDVADNPAALVKCASRETIVDIIFRRHASCMTMLNDEERKEVDSLIEKIESKSSEDDVPTLIDNVDKLIRLIKRRKWENIDRSGQVDVVSRIKEYVDENISSQEINLDEIASKINFSKYYMLHTFKQQTGMSVFQYINQRKLKIAKDLLLTTDLKYSEIGERIGFVDQVYFSYWFKKQTNMSMKTYCAINKKAISS